MTLIRTVALSLLVASPALAAVPSTVAHQGRLLDADGIPLDGAISVTFALYGSAGGSDMLWSETQEVSFNAGYYAVQLGGSTAIDASALDAAELYVGLTVDGTEIPGRVRVSSVPYALRADTATNVKGGTVDATAITVNGAPITGSDGKIPWDAISGAPEPTDTLGDLLCTSGQIAQFDGSSWGCADIDLDAIDAAAITTGTLAYERLPVGTSAGSVAAGEHTHDAAQVVSGTFDAARVPDLDAAKIASGTLDAARIPDLDAAKITTGQLAAARIADLDAAKITTGQFAVARLPVGTGATQVAAGNHNHTAAQVGALPIGGGTLTGGLTGTTAAFSGAVTAPSFTRTCAGGNQRAAWTSGTNANNHCYARFDTGASFYQSQLNCEAWGGYLATPNSAEENTFLQANFGVAATTWIGLSDARNQGTWDTVGGQSMILANGNFNYRNWSAGEPNGSTGEDCAHMYQNGSWNDVNCANAYPYVCERDF